MKQLNIAMWARASLFRPFTDTNVYGTDPLQYGKLAADISVDIRILLQCTPRHSQPVIHSSTTLNPNGDSRHFTPSNNLA